MASPLDRPRTPLPLFGYANEGTGPPLPPELEFQDFPVSGVQSTNIPHEIKPAPEHCTCHEQGPPFRARERGWRAGRQRPKPFDHEDVIRLESGTFCKSCTLLVVL